MPTDYRGLHRRSVFLAQFAEHGDDPENISFILEELLEEFDDDELESQITLLMADDASRNNTADSVARLRELAGSGYSATFSRRRSLSERVLWPHAPSESNGLEDARFVRFVGDHAASPTSAPTPRSTVCDIAQHILDTKDFRTFRSSPMIGAARGDQGTRLFPGA